MISYFYPIADIPTDFCCCIRSRFRRDVQVPVTQRSFGLFAGELKGRSLFQMTPNQIGRLPSKLRQATEGHTTVAHNMMRSKRVKQRFKYRQGLDGAAKQRAAKKESCCERGSSHPSSRVYAWPGPPSQKAKRSRGPTSTPCYHFESIHCSDAGATLEWQHMQEHCGGTQSIRDTCISLGQSPASDQLVGNKSNGIM